MKTLRTTKKIRVELDTAKAEEIALIAEDKRLRARLAEIDKRQQELRNWGGYGEVPTLVKELKIAENEEADTDKPRIGDWIIVGVTPKLVKARHYGSLPVSQYNETHQTFFPFTKAREMWAEYLATKDGK